MERTTTVPKREFLRLLRDNDTSENGIMPLLPHNVPIVGLGCSSFSTFFWTKEELEGVTQSNNESNNTAQVSAAASEITVEALSRDHPKVQEWIETIHYAVQHCGITLLDTAPWYGHGTSEIVVGWALEEILSNKDENNDNNEPREGETATITTSSGIAREDLCINTKVGRYEADPKEQFDFSRTATLESAQRSIERLRCGYIDVLQLHDPEFSPTLNVLLEETIPAMVECRDKGWCRALGLTGYPLEVQYQILTQSLEMYGTENSRRIWDQALTYGHFNLHDSSLVHRRVNPTWASFADFCHHNKLGVLAAAPLSMGLLTHSEPPDWHPANNSELAKACAEAAGICKGLGVNIADLAILYAISHPSLPCTILGMKNKQQVECAVSLASRFQMVDWGIPELTQEMVLSFVLTLPEKRAWDILRDGENGPFADVWKKKTTEDYDGHGGAFRPKYQWDGIREVHEFWKSVEGASYEDWQDKSFR